MRFSTASRAAVSADLFPTFRDASKKFPSRNREFEEEVIP
jgi:hypothetical protein